MESGEVRATLWDGLGSIADHRQASGRRFELQSILGIGLGAVLAGRASLAGIARWGRGLSARQLRAFGIERDRAPCHATYHYVFKGLDVIALERVLGYWAESVSGEGGHVSIDGKTARGSRHGEVPGVHLLAAYSDSLQGVLGQCRVPPETNEITAALHLLKAVPIKGKVVTGDAIFTQKAVCKAIIERGGDYFFTVKANQPQLRDDIATVFAKSVSPLGAAAMGGRHRPCGRARQRARSDRAPGTMEQRKPECVPGLARRQAGVPDRPAADRRTRDRE